MSADGQPSTGEQVRPDREQQAPWAKLVRPGRNEEDRQTPVDYRRDLTTAVRRDDRTLTSGVSLLVRLPHLCRDPAAATDLVPVCLCPGSDVAGAAIAGCLSCPLTPAADLAGV
jgi:hypothetical protein